MLGKMTRIALACHAAEGFSKIGRLSSAFQTATPRSEKFDGSFKVRMHALRTKAGKTQNFTFSLAAKYA
jgi:hypothetical protein